MKPSQPIIIDKKHRGGHAGHHGGAWKVAYADFVTAMMAFFLVMWLVTQSQEVKASVAGYFRDPGVFDYEKSTGVLPGGTPGVEAGGAPTAVPPPSPAALLQEQRVLAGAAEHIRERLAISPSLATLTDQIEFTITSEGLKIELIERSDSSFFDSGSAELRGESEHILQIISAELTRLENDVVLEGHTDRHQYADSNRYSNWELSADRANAARRAMARAGLRNGQVKGVRGFADTQLHVKDSPLDPRNRRISIVVRSQAATALENAIKERQDMPSLEAPAPPAQASAPVTPAHE
jgi:chemotaxis protein MotB